MTRSTYPLRPLLALSAATFTSVSAELMPTGVLRSLSSSLSVTDATTGLLVTAWAGTIALTSIPLVRMTRGWQRGSLVRITLSVMAVANLATAAAPTYGIALGARIIAAAAHGLFWAVVVSYAASLVNPDRVGRALSIVLAGPTLASLVGLPVGTAIATKFGWRVTFVGLAVACVVSAVTVALSSPTIVNTSSLPQPERWDRSAKFVLLVGGGGFFSLVGCYAVLTFIVPVSNVIGGIQASAMPGVLLASGIGGLIGVVVAGRISDRWPIWALTITVLLIAASLVAIGMSAAFVAYISSITVWGALVGVLPVLLQANVMRVASDQFRTTAGSVLVTVLNLGIGAGAALGSLVSDGYFLNALPFIAAATTTIAIVPLGLSLRSSLSLRERNGG